MEKLDFLIKYLLKENTNITIDKIPDSLEDKKKLWRSLCNIRNAKPISSKYLEMEHKYLQSELKNNQVTKVDNIKTISKTIKESSFENENKICLWQGDITTLQIDAIVNAANSQGLGCFIPCHKCIDNQINTFAGVELRIECNEIMKSKNYFLDTGNAIITKGYNLSCTYIIHTVGPIIQTEVTKEDKIKLADCYKNSLELAIKNGIRTIAFPCISTGEFRFPKEDACKIAISTVEKFLKEHKENFDKIVFNVYGEEDYKIYERNIKQSGTNKKINK